MELHFDSPINAFAGFFSSRVGTGNSSITEDLDDFLHYQALFWLFFSFRVALITRPSEMNIEIVVINLSAFTRNRWAFSEGFLIPVP